MDNNHGYQNTERMEVDDTPLFPIERPDGYYEGIMEPHVTNGLHITTDTTGEQNAMNNLDQQNGHENDNL